MVTMLGSDSHIDVSEYVLKKGYKPIYCNKDSIEICKLICNNTKVLNSSHKKDIVYGIISLLKVSESQKFRIDSVNFEKFSKYKYSYFIDKDLVDVYELMSLLMSLGSIRLWQCNSGITNE